MYGISDLKASRRTIHMKRLLALLLTVVMVCALLPAAAFADDAANITAVSINGIANPTAGEKLDYEFDIVTDPSDALVTEGEYAPEVIWLVFNGYSGDWDVIEDADYICQAGKAYRALVCMAPAENYSFSFNGSEFAGTLLFNGSKSENLVGYSVENGLCADMTFAQLPVNSDHLVSSMTLSAMPSNVVIGDPVAGFSPAKLQDAGKSCRYFWFIEKYKNGNDSKPVATYIPESKTALALELLPDVTEEEIAASRQAFGSSFASGYDYRLVNIQVLNSGYVYSSGNLHVKVTLTNSSVLIDNYVAADPMLSAKAVYVWLKPVKVSEPAAPYLSITPSAGKVKLSWYAVPGADEYQIARSTDGSRYTRITTVTGTSYTNTTVAGGTKYYYKVRAVNTVGDTTHYSSYSNVATCIVPLSAPTFTAKIDTGKVVLTFDAVKGADKINIYRSTDGKTFSFLESSFKTTYTDKDVKAGTTYYYKAKALKTADDSTISSAYSDIQTIKVLKAPKVSISSTDSTVKLSWKAVDGAVKYKIFRGAKGYAYKLFTTTTKTSFTNTSVEGGTTYFYKIVCVDANGGTSDFSAPVSVKPMAKPTLTAKLAIDKVDLSWEKVRGASKYELYRSTDGVNFKLYDTVTKLSYTNGSVTEGKTYYYKVRAVGAEGVFSAYSDVQQVNILCAPKLSVSVADGKVKLSWPAVDGAAKYQIYRSTDNKTFSLLSTTAKTAFTNTSVTAGTKYYYKVVALDTNGGSGKASYIKSIVPLATPTLTAALSSGSVKLSWTAVEGATKYQLYRSTDGESFKLYDTVSKTSYSSSSVTAGTTYYYKVAAVKTIGETDWAGNASAVKSVTVLAAPVLTAASEDGAVLLSWEAADGAAKYQVYRSTDNKTFTRLSTVTDTSYTDSSVTAGAKYYYKVNAVDENGSSSKFSYIKAAVPMATPVLSAELAEGAVSLSWTAVDGAAKYELYRSVDGADFELLGSLTDTTFTDTSAAEGSSYCYKVVAVKTIGETDWLSSFSNETGITV